MAALFLYRECACPHSLGAALAHLFDLDQSADCGPVVRCGAASSLARLFLVQELRPPEVWWPSFENMPKLADAEAGDVQSDNVRRPSRSVGGAGWRSPRHRWWLLEWKWMAHHAPLGTRLRNHCQRGGSGFSLALNALLPTSFPATMVSRSALCPLLAIYIVFKKKPLGGGAICIVCAITL